MKQQNNEDKAGLSRQEVGTLVRRGIAFWWQVSHSLYLSSACTAVAQAAAPLVSLWFSARLLDGIAAGADGHTLAVLAVQAVASGAVLSLLSAACSRWETAAHEIVWRAGKARLHDKLQGMDFACLDDPQTSALYQSILQEQRWGGRGLATFEGQFVNSFLPFCKILGALVLVVPLFTQRVPAGSAYAWLDSPLALLGLALSMAAVAVLSRLISVRSYAYESSLTTEATLSNRLFGFCCWTAFRDRARALDIRTYEQDRFFNAKSRGLDGWSENGRIAHYARTHLGFATAAGTALARSFTIVIYLYVCLKALGGAFGVGSVAQYVSAMTMLSGGLTTLLEQLTQLWINARDSLRTVFEFLDLPNEMYQGTLAVEKRSDRKYNIEFRHVSFRYPGSKVWALEDVSLKFTVGERLAVVGPNGSGKTTMIKLLCRLYDPTEGEILLNNIDIRKYDYAEYLHIFSVVFQDFQLLALPLGANVAGAAQYDPERAAQCLADAGLGNRMQTLPHGLDTCLYKEFDKEGVEISGGEAQKIAIARALYKDAPFIILDEPTAALDPIAEAEVYASFDTLISDRTAIYISHRLSSCRFCDRIAVFVNGRIVQFGTHDTLVADTEGEYYQLWQAQAQYYT